MYVKALLSLFEYARQCSGGSQDSAFYLEDADSDEEGEWLHNGEESTAENGELGRKIERKQTRHNVISRKDNLLMVPSKPDLKSLAETDSADKKTNGDLSVNTRMINNRLVSVATFKRDFELGDVLDYLKTGVACIIEDEVTQRFVPEELKSWNLMTRTNKSFEFINWRITALWILGCWVRYCLLFPARLIVGLLGLSLLILSCLGLSWVSHPELKRWLYERIALTLFRCLSRCFSAQIDFHNPENRPLTDGICVANHTSPIDVLILSTDRPYSMVGQTHGGLLGLCQRSLSLGASHIWFQRAEVNDRAAVSKRLRDHVEDPDKLPILIFPEGTCINNTSVMQFKKGSMEVGGVIYPAAIKYDARFGDAFWNSSRFSMVQYILMMMTSWALVVDVWYLPPMKIQDGENAIDFANRVKHQIAKKGGLVDLLWDGNLKRQRVKSEWKIAQQQHFSKRINTCQ